MATAGGRVGALLLTFDAEFMDGGLASSAANATLEPGELPSHWGQQVAYPDLWCVCVCVCVCVCE